MDGNPTKYFWAEPDGGADLRLSLPLDCFCFCFQSAIFLSFLKF